MEVELNQVSKKLTLSPLNLDRLILNRLFHQKPDLSDKDFKNKSVENNNHISDIEITDAIEQLENESAYLYSIEALMEKIFDIKVVKNVEVEFKKISKKLAPDPLNIDRLILNRLLHQIPDLPDNNNFK